MSEDIQIRTVAVEFLRAGPPHNQLLSPLTQYLAVCGDAGAGVVTVPYEHAAFERRLKELRYETGDTADRLQMLNDIGVEMGKLLGAVPGLPGALTIDPSKAATLIQLRLTLSANELAHLPFELAKVPVGAGATSETWLAIQTRPPVCVTRNIRTVSSEGVAWPHKPRILFISGDPDVVPFVEHRDALLDAIKPFRYPGLAADSSGNREEIGDLLTILTNASLAEVQQECLENTYSHVHILTHGDQDEASRDSYGLVLRGEDDSPDVVSGERFANALTSVGRDCVHRPAVVTVASCDSGNIGTVTIPGASFAHALHQAGIPLVVASQFPLSMVGSVPLARTLYPGLLWGDHPLLVMQRLRAELHARYTSTWHDWASLVVYEALPYDLAQQLDRLRYSQSRRAMDSALEAIDRAVQSNAAESLPELDAAIERAVQRLPMTGQYSVECLGLRASARKRLAQAAFTLSGRGAEVRKWRDPFDLLEQSWVDYRDAVRRLLVNDGTTVQRVATLHWVLVQAVCLAAVLGKDKDLEQWETAKLCADLYCDHADQEERAWAYASLAELYLLRLGERGLSHELQRDMHKAALEQADRLVGAYPFRTEFPVTSTLRQFRRYVDWWGQKRFQDVLTERASARPSWDALLGTANELIRKLDRGSTHAAPGGGAPPSSTPPSSALTGSSPPGSPPPGSPPPGSPPPGSPPPGSPPPGSPPPGSPPPGSPPPGAAPAVAGARTNADGARLASASSSRGRSRRVPSATAASSSATVRREGPFFDVETLPAGHGDALWIEYGDASATHRLLVDCGTQQTVAHLMARVGQVPEGERRLELFVMSHIDSDHIGGALPFFRAVKDGLRFGDVWFNGWRHLSGQLGARQGEMFSTALQDFKLPWNQWRDRDAIVIDSDELPVCQLPGGMTLTLLSPQPAQLARLAPVWMREMKRYGLEPGSRVDYSRFLRGSPSSSTDIDALADTPFSGDGGVPNGTSIALLAEFGGAALLLGADAYAPVLVDTIKRLLKQRGVDKLKLAAFKVAHHGSQNNSSNELIELLDCPEYLLSSNGDHFCHPDREAVARIIRHGGPRASLRFNYRTRYNDVWAQPELQERYGYAAHYPAADASGVVLSLLAPRS